MRKLNLTKESAILLMDLHKQGVDMRVIAKKLDCSPAFISIFTRAFNGNIEQFNKLAQEHRDIIEELRPKHLIHYECSIFWGLVKLKFKPIP